MSLASQIQALAIRIGNEVKLKLNASDYTATDVLNKIKTVDGVGSGLDADLLDGVNSTDYIKVGQYGIGGTDLSLVYLTNVNAIPNTGIYVMDTPSSNGPLTSSMWGYVINLRDSATWGAQLLFDGTAPHDAYFRCQYNGVWAAWKKLWNSTNFDPATKANLASPVFSGNPTVPTQATSDNSTRIANTAFVKAVVAALVASSPAALDTLNELAVALGNDANFATTMTNALAGKVGTSDSRLTDTRTPTDTSVTYAKVDVTLKQKNTVTSSVDLSANGIGQITLAANTAFTFSGFELNKSYLLIITSNGFTPSWAVGAKHVPVTGNEAFGTTGVFYVNLTCIDATVSSEKLLTMIMKG